MGQREYAAFISYRHKPLDREAAIAVQKKVEHFRVPKEYRGQTGGKKIGYVFRDEDELPTSSSLSDSIRDALSHSKHLIVICTPDLPQSKWCEEEIRYFLETHPRDDVIAVLVSGEPEESFPPLLTHVYGPDGEVIERIEPLAANITGDAQHFSRKRFTKESVRICAALIGCPFDELWHRERRYRMQRFAAAGAAGFAAMAVFAGFLAVKNRQISLKNEQITAQNEQITAQNGQITAQNLALKER